MAERSVGRRATRRRSIEPGRVQALRRIAHGSRADEVLARDRVTGDTLEAREVRLSPLEMEKAPCNGAFWSVLFPPPDGVRQ
jgi:hypothetical protein